MAKTSTNSRKMETTSMYSEGIRRVTRSSMPQEERVVHLKNFQVTRKLGEFSDDDESQFTKDVSMVKKQKISFSEYVALIFNITFGPVFLLSLFIFCNKSSCSFTSLPDFNQFKSLSVFFDLQSLLGFSLMFIFVALLSAFPYGGKKISNLPNKQGKFVYNCNGAFCLIVTVLTWMAIEYRLFPISKFVTEHILHLAISSFILGGVFPLYLYLRSFYVPISALNAAQIDKPALSGFFYGKEVNPRLFDVLDLKMFVMKFITIAVFILDVSYLYNGLNLPGNLQSTIVNLNWKVLTSHPTLFLLVVFHVLYTFQYLIFESQLLSGYFYQYEGLGYKIVLECLLYPFFFALQTKYVMEQKVHLPNWALIVLSVLFVFGYALFTLSNRQKNEFRRNPYSSATSKMDSLSTSQGKKILCSGCWGYLRQPNIAGDILLHISMLCFTYNSPPLIGFLGLIFALIERAIGLQADCKKKYGSSWDKYCQKVKYVLLPKVY